MTRILLAALILIAAAWCAANVSATHGPDSTVGVVQGAEKGRASTPERQYLANLEADQTSDSFGSRGSIPQRPIQYPQSAEPYVLVVHDLNGPPEAIQTQYIEWAMEALPACADDDPDDCLRIQTFIRGGAHVTFCESGQDPAKTGLEGEKSHWQNHPIHEWRYKEHGWSWEEAADPVKGTVIAYEIYSDAGGWTPWWRCRRSIP